jgi:hypothetical protein
LNNIRSITWIIPNLYLNKEILDKFGQVILDVVHKKTCHNLQSILSGYSNPTHPYAQLFLEYAQLNEHAKKIVNKLLLEAVNKTIANFLFFLSDFDQLDASDTIVVNVYYADKNKNKTSIAGIMNTMHYENYAGLFSCEWLEKFATFKDEIAPENPRRIEHIKVFPSNSKCVEEFVAIKQSVSQFDMENKIAEVRNKTKREMSSLLGSSYLCGYLVHRFPEMKPEQWNEIEKIGNNNGDRFSDMFDKALESQSLETYIEELRVLW